MICVLQAGQSSRHVNHVSHVSHVFREVRAIIVCIHFWLVYDIIYLSPVIGTVCEHLQLIWGLALGI